MQFLCSGKFLVDAEHPDEPSLVLDEVCRGQEFPALGLSFVVQQGFSISVSPLFLQFPCKVGHGVTQLTARNPVSNGDNRLFRVGHIMDDDLTPRSAHSRQKRNEIRVALQQFLICHIVVLLFLTVIILLLFII